MIACRQVSVNRSGQSLFNDFNWSIQRGEHWLIQGPSGSGKTILLELLAGVIHPAQGKVEYEGIDELDWDKRALAIRRMVHYVPAHALEIFLRGQGDIFYQQRYYSVEEVDIPLVKDVVGVTQDKLSAMNFPPSLNVSPLLDLPITRLSNGQLKKMLILREFGRQVPQVLLLDFPFEGLDKDSRHELVMFLQHLVEAFQVQLVVVDHAHHLLMMNKRLVLEGFSVKTKEPISSSNHEDEIAPAENVALPSSSDPIVELKQVTIRYGNKTILENLSWTINKGERWALTGKNGSGKTTLFSLIYADHPMAYSQPVFLFGKRRGTGESIWDIKNRITYLGPEQISYLNPKSIPRTAKEYIVEGVRAFGKEFDELTLLFDAEHIIRKQIRHLSSGELQLVLLIKTLLHTNELLLLDEPFQFLDPARKESLQHYLDHFLQSNVTLVLITHYEEDVARWTQLRKSL